MRGAANAFLAILITIPRASGAQRAPQVAPGDRVRVWVQRGSDNDPRPWATGTLAALGPDSVVVWDGQGPPRSTPLALVRWVDVSLGRTGHRTGRGAVIGAAAGALILATVGYVAYQPAPRSPDCEPESWFCGSWDFGRGGAAVGGLVLGGASGAIIGAVVGSSLPGRERWVTLPQERLGPHVPEQDARLLLGVSRRF